MDKSRVFNRQLDPELVGAKIFRLRNEAGLSRKELSVALDASVWSIGAYECGRRCPPYEHIQLLGNALGVAPECLRIYSFPNLNAVKAALRLLCVDYRLGCSFNGGSWILFPTGTFMTRFFNAWLGVVEQVRQGSLSVIDMLSWQDSFRQRDFSEEDFPRRCAFSMTDKYFPAWCFSKQLSSLRKQHGLSQATFAEELGISLTKYRDFEQGRRLPDAELRALIAQKLNVPAGAFLIFDFLNPLQAAHVLFQLSNMMRWVPERKTINGATVPCLEIGRNLVADM